MEILPQAAHNPSTMGTPWMLIAYYSQRNEAPCMGIAYRVLLSTPTTRHYIDGASDRLRCGRRQLVRLEVSIFNDPLISNIKMYV